MAANVMNAVQDITENFAAENESKGNDDENEESINENNDNSAAEEDINDDNTQINDNEDAGQKNENENLEEQAGDFVNSLLAGVTSENDKHTEHEIKEPENRPAGSRRSKKYANDENAFNIPDLPFAPQPKDPNITHYIFEGEYSSQNRMKSARNSRRNYQRPQTNRGAPINGSLYDNSPYFSKPFTIYKVPPLPHRNDRQLASARSKNYDKASDLNYSGLDKPRQPTMKYRDPTYIPSDYVARTREAELRNQRYGRELVQKYKSTHPLHVYQPHYQRTVLDAKIEMHRREQQKSRRHQEMARKQRMHNRKVHEQFVQKTVSFEYELLDPKQRAFQERINNTKRTDDLFDYAFPDDQKSQSHKSERTKGELENQFETINSALLDGSSQHEQESNQEEEEHHELEEEVHEKQEEDENGHNEEEENKDE